jgi:hypothetical protein
MKTFKQFQEEMNKPSIGAAAKAGQLIAAPIAFGLNILKGIAQGKHKKRKIFKKEGS